MIGDVPETWEATFAFDVPARILEPASRRGGFTKPEARHAAKLDFDEMAPIRFKRSRPVAAILQNQ